MKLVFDCGQVIDYTCANFDSEEENRKYIEDNILHHHIKIPMGEFAIGTNTTAYVAANKYGIADKLPILIAEKMGPHFAVGIPATVGLKILRSLIRMGERSLQETMKSLNCVRRISVRRTMDAIRISLFLTKSWEASG